MTSDTAVTYGDLILTNPVLQNLFLDATQPQNAANKHYS